MFLSSYVPKGGYCFLVFILIFSWFFVTGSGCVSLENESLENLSLDKFNNDLNKYIPSARWIAKDLLSMNATTFTKAWEKIVLLLCYEPWNYFCSSKDKFDRWDYQKRMSYIVSECLAYDFLLQNLFVNRNDGTLLYFPYGSKHFGIDQDYYSIFDYWRLKHVTIQHDFYAFYFDQGFVLLADTIQSAYINLDNAFLYSLFEGKTQRIFAYLKQLFKRLRSSKHEVRYDHQLRRYKSVLTWLSKEKRAYDLQWLS